MTLFTVLLVGLGGFVGAIARFSVSQWISKKLSFHFPFATLFINMSGSFLLGFIIGININEYFLLLLGTGLLGAFTTFSTFKLEGIQLHFNKRKKHFLIYNFISYVGGIVLAFLGIEIGQLTTNYLM